MQLTIYIDVVIIENLIMNYIILFATGIILKIQMKHIRLIIASLIGAVYSIMTYIITIKLYSNMIFKIILSIIIVYIAYNPQTIKKMWKYLLIFYLTSFVFGGAAFALIYIVKPQDILMKNGLFLGTYPLKTILLGAVVAFIITITAFKIVKTKISKKDMFCTIKISINEKEIIAKAMIDTGNLLREPITGKPVVVLEHILLYDAIPKEILNNLDKILGGDFEKVPENIKKEYISKLKLIPFASLGKQNGMLLGIKCKEIELINYDIDTKKEDVIIGIYNKSLTKQGEYNALVGIEMIGE